MWHHVGFSMCHVTGDQSGVCYHCVLCGTSGITCGCLCLLHPPSRRCAWQIADCPQGRVVFLIESSMISFFELRRCLQWTVLRGCSCFLDLFVFIWESRVFNGCLQWIVLCSCFYGMSSMDCPQGMSCFELRLVRAHLGESV